MALLLEIQRHQGPVSLKRRTGLEPATSSLGRWRPYLGYGLQINDILLRGSDSVPHWDSKNLLSTSWNRAHRRFVGRWAGLGVCHGRQSPRRRRSVHAQSNKLIRAYRGDHPPRRGRLLSGKQRRSRQGGLDDGPSGGNARSARAYRAALSVVRAVGLSEAPGRALSDSSRGPRRVLARQRPQHGKPGAPKTA
jgi:hypothetical protein